VKKLLEQHAQSLARFTEEKSMFYFRSTLVSFIVALLSSGVALAGSVTSGPQVGEKVPGPFKPLNITGPEAGQASCQYCKNGTRPVAVIFAKAITPEVAQLLKKIDTATEVNKEHGLDRQLLAVAQQMQIQNTILTLYKAGGPEKYHLNPDADVTVLLYNHLTVKANHAFKFITSSLAIPCPSVKSPPSSKSRCRAPHGRILGNVSRFRRNGSLAGRARGCRFSAADRRPRPATGPHRLQLRLCPAAAGLPEGIACRSLC
jgi:hypothetical protein